eukprot:scaffold97939_cov47-Phaeocystis_antarctica.AAC.1
MGCAPYPHALPPLPPPPCSDVPLRRVAPAGSRASLPEEPRDRSGTLRGAARHRPAFLANTLGIGARLVLLGRVAHGRASRSEVPAPRRAPRSRACCRALGSTSSKPSSGQICRHRACPLLCPLSTRGS